MSILCISLDWAGMASMLFIMFRLLPIYVEALLDRAGIQASDIAC